MIVTILLVVGALPIWAMASLMLAAWQNDGGHEMATFWFIVGMLVAAIVMTFTAGMLS